MAAHWSTYVKCLDHPGWSRPPRPDGLLGPHFGTHSNEVWYGPPPGSPAPPPDCPDELRYCWNGTSWLPVDAEYAALPLREGHPDAAVDQPGGVKTPPYVDPDTVGSPESSSGATETNTSTSATLASAGPVRTSQTQRPRQEGRSKPPAAAAGFSATAAPGQTNNYTPASSARLPCLDCMRFLKHRPNLIFTHDGSVDARGNFSTCNNCKAPRNRLCRSVPAAHRTEAARVHRLAQRVPLQTAGLLKDWV